MPLQQYFSYNLAVSFIGGGNQSTGEQVTDKLYHIPVMLYRVHPAMRAGLKLTTLALIA